MRLDEYALHDGLGLADLIRRKEISRIDVIEAALNAVHVANPALNAVIEVYEEASRAAARGPCNPSAPFAGVPFLLKDIGSHDADVRFEMGSRLAQGLRAPPFASELVHRFRASGVTVLGRTNIPEFGSSCTTEPYLYGPTHNPWNLKRTPGGSSGGAAAAIASGVVPIAHANDAGGSIRVPASCCGLFGLKPSRNLNPVGPDAAHPVNGFAAEHILARTVRDSAAMLDATAGPDAGAWCYTPRLAGSYLEDARRPTGRLRIALNLAPRFPPAPIDAEILDLTRATAHLCASLGHEVEEAGPEFDPDPMLEAFSTIWMTGLRAALEGISALTQRAVSADTVEPHLLAAWRDAAMIPAVRLQLALEQMNTLARAYGRLFQNYDVLLSPLLSTEPFPLGEVSTLPTEHFHEWFVGMSRHSPFTASVNAAGVPAMSVPLGMTRSGLPVGSHFVAALGNESILLRLATQLESAQPWMGRRPAHHVANLAPAR
jgi:amidase